MTPLLLALGASLAWGVGDFFGPLISRTLGVLPVLLWAQVGGVARDRASPSRSAAQGPAGWGVLYAIGASFGGMLGLFAYYRGMNTGTMSVVAPIAGVSAVIPVIFGIATGDHPSVAQVAGVAAALAGVGLASIEHQRGPAARRGGRRARAARGVRVRLLLPVDARRGQGRLLVGVARLPHDGAAARRDGGRTAGRIDVRLSRRNVAIAVAVGIVDTVGNVCFAASSQHGLVSLTAVLASLYPIVTVLLAASILHERVAPLQRAGIALTLAGVVLIGV